MDSPAAAPNSKISALAPDRAIVLRNVACVYCGTSLTKETADRDHVIARRFVPKGKFDARWNLIVNACKPCNSSKADLEDDISAITLQPDLLGRFGHDDPDLIEEARRKANDSRSRRTRKPVKDSREELKVHASLGPGINATFGFVSPPQIDQARAFELARLQLMAFFYMQTYNRESRRGGYWLHGYHPVMVAPRSDWGNPVSTAFMRAIENWDCRLYGNTADGFFRLITRKHPSAETWAWAVEWNRTYRVIGFFGEREPAQALVDSFPRLRAQTVYQKPNESLSYRVEIALDQEDDTLFRVPDATEQTGSNS